MAKNIKTIEKNFKTIKELVNYCENGKHRSDIFYSQRSMETGKNRKKFTLTKDFSEAKNLLLNGWEEGAKKLTKSLKLANVKMQDKIVQRSVYDIVGFQASVPRYLQGIPTSMVNKKNIKQKQKIITLTKSIAYHAGISAEKILEDSTKFLQIVQGIEKKGFRANVNIVLHSRVDSYIPEQVIYKTRIKSANERLNISKMSFSLLHPSFLRRIMFKALEVDQELINKGWDMGYGQPQHNTQQFLEKNEYFIPVMISDQQALEIIENTNIK